MSLGKTMQCLGVLAAFHSQRESNPTTEFGAESKATLIVVPKSVLQQWAVDVQRFLPEST